jgi:hypothetical protein
MEYIGSPKATCRVGLQTTLKRHWSKALIVNVEEKVPPDGISCESYRRSQANLKMRRRKVTDDFETGVFLYTKINPGGICLLLGGIQNKGGVTLI